MHSVKMVLDFGMHMFFKVCAFIHTCLGSKESFKTKDLSKKNLNKGLTSFLSKVEILLQHVKIKLAYFIRLQRHRD